MRGASLFSDRAMFFDAMCCATLRMLTPPSAVPMHLAVRRHPVANAPKVAKYPIRAPLRTTTHVKAPTTSLYAWRRQESTAVLQRYFLVDTYHPPPNSN